MLDPSAVAPPHRPAVNAQEGKPRLGWPMQDYAPDGEETVSITGDRVLMEVLAAAQRFAAWYTEYLSRGTTGAASAGADWVSCKLQHAVFDLMAAVHEMNRHCSAAGSTATITTAPRRRISEDALH